MGSAALGAPQSPPWSLHGETHSEGRFKQGHPKDPQEIKAPVRRCTVPQFPLLHDPAGAASNSRSTLCYGHGERGWGG